VVENELCPVLVARIDAEAVRPAPEEVGELRWMPWSEYVEDVTARPASWSPWSVEEARRLDADARFQAWYAALES